MSRTKPVIITLTVLMCGVLAYCWFARLHYNHSNDYSNWLHAQFSEAAINRFDPIQPISQVEAEQSNGFTSAPITSKNGPIVFVCSSALPRESDEYAAHLAAVMTAAMNLWAIKSAVITVTEEKGHDGKMHTVISASPPL